MFYIYFIPFKKCLFFVSYFEILFINSNIGNTQVLSCPENYRIIIESSILGVNKIPSTICHSNTNTDCMANYDFASQNCPGLQYCTLKDFKSNTTRLPECGNKFADYMRVAYRCVPILDAGNPPRANVELCKNDDSANFLLSQSAAIFQNENYPLYPFPKSTICKKNITTVAGSHLKVYLNVAVLQSITGVIHK